MIELIAIRYVAKGYTYRFTLTTTVYKNGVGETITYTVSKGTFRVSVTVKAYKVTSESKPLTRATKKVMRLTDQNGLADSAVIIKPSSFSIQ